jgi:hypothetical protein
VTLDDNGVAIENNILDKYVNNNVSSPEEKNLIAVTIFFICAGIISVILLLNIIFSAFISFIFYINRNNNTMIIPV